MDHENVMLTVRKDWRSYEFIGVPIPDLDLPFVAEGLRWGTEFSEESLGGFEFLQGSGFFELSFQNFNITLCLAESFVSFADGYVKLL